MSENNKCKYDGIKDYKTAFECFKQRFLVEKKSIFDLTDLDTDCKEEESKNENCCILNKDSVQYLVDNFIDRGLGGKASFIDKIKMQLIGDENFRPVYSANKTDEEKKQIQKNAIKVLAHCVWLWRLVPSNAKKSSTINSVKEILDLDDTLKNIKLEQNKFFMDDVGIAKTGTYYNTNKPSEIAFIIKFLEKYINPSNGTQEYINILLEEESDKGYGKVIIKTAEDSKGKLLVLDKGSIIVNTLENNKNDKEDKPKSAAIFHALLHFFKPDDYEAIVSMGHKEAIVKTFSHLTSENENENEIKPEIDNKLKYIKKILIDEYNINETDFTFYHKKIVWLWKSQELNFFKNIIYHGAPGTGKTYELKEEIQNYIDMSGGKEKFIQFHSAYTYEDFIGGLRPDMKSTNGLNLIYQNGIFKQLCKEAARYELAYYQTTQSSELLEDKTVLKADSEITICQDKKEEKFTIKKNIPVLSQFPPYFILIDEINRADLSKVFGELLYAIEDDYRGYENKFTLSSSAMETVNTAVCWEDDQAYFFVPKNVYIRGTMNDIDRSVDSIDFAFRRRFKWVEKKYEEDILREMLKNKTYNNIEEYIKSCNNLNNEILKISIADESFKIGHAILRNILKYTKSTTITKESKEKLFTNHIEPIIYNYLKMDYGNEAKNIDEFKKIFTK